MSLKQYNPFWVPFWKIKVSNYLTKKYELLKLVNWDNPECQYENHFTDYFIEKNYLTPFTELISNELQQFANDLQGSINITDLWAQRYVGNTNNMSPHTHGNHGYSAILYAEFNPEVHQPTQFLAPFKNFSNGEDLIHKPEVEEGDILIFPSSIIHYASPSHSKEQRTIFSWNMK